MIHPPPSTKDILWYIQSPSWIFWFRWSLWIKTILFH